MIEFRSIHRMRLETACKWSITDDPLIKNCARIFDRTHLFQHYAKFASEQKMMRYRLRTLMTQFTIRDMLWLTAVIALVVVWRFDLARNEETIVALITDLEQERTRNLKSNLNRFTDLDVVETPLKDVAEYLTDRHGYPCLLGSDVNGEIPITGTFKGVRLRVALETLLAPHGLTFRTTDSDIIIERKSLTK
jgi:hypothetical protein